MKLKRWKCDDDFFKYLNKLANEPEEKWINRLECAYRKANIELPKAKSPHENVIYVEFKNERIKV
jgi:DNA-binding transcriptional regulator GbsR (MarR family)